MKKVLALLGILLFATGCATAKSVPAPPRPLADEAAAGVTDPALRDLLAREWDARMRASPTWATHLGDHRFDDRMDDVSPAGVAAARAERRDFLAEARALPVDRLEPADRMTLALFTETLAGELALAACAPETWRVSARENAITAWIALGEDLVIASRADAAHLLARYCAMPRAIDGASDNLRVGLAVGKTAAAESLRRTVLLLDGELAKPARDWGLAVAAVHPHPGWTADDEQTFAVAITRAVDEGIRPAIRRYRDLLADEILPRARAAEGLGAMPGGPACYRALIRSNTTVDQTAEELHALGRAEIARVDGELEELGDKVFGTRDLPAILARLRGDPRLSFHDAGEIEAAARRALGAAKAKIPSFFGLLPRADCSVGRIPDYEAPYTTTGYYREANPDGSRPGIYMVNVYAPRTRPRYDAEVLAFHESIPGHHLQIAIAQELPQLPAFRRFGAWTAFVEGWALYSERLADEMGLYSGDLDRMGMLSFDAWRGARLVVDTGIHAMGWTRAQAEQYLRDHTALGENNIVNEVDRYIGDPAQALAYKVGELTIRALRADAEKRLGARFDLKAFHDVVLGGGAVTLAVLRERVEEWIKGRR